MPIYASIDIGTLTLRLLIARIEDDGRLHELASERRIVRLGEGLQPSRCLQPAPMARVLETIAEGMPVIERVGSREVVAASTSRTSSSGTPREGLPSGQPPRERCVGGGPGSADVLRTLPSCTAR